MSATGLKKQKDGGKIFIYVVKITLPAAVYIIYV